VEPTEEGLERLRKAIQKIRKEEVVHVALLG
jgi:hypothetical protein